MSDYQYINETGTIVPDTSDILTTVEGEYTGTFGADLNTSPTTPQGVLIQAEALARSEVVANNAAVGNQMNPNIAGGPFLAAICAMTGLEVPVATYSTLRLVDVTGDPFTNLPAGSQARIGPNGAIFQSITATTFDADGNGVVDFQALDAGPIACGTGDLDTIVTEVLGWETVSNPSVAEVGTAKPTDAEVRALRRNTLALQGIGLVEATISALYDTPGVKSLAFRENWTDATVVIDGITLVKHSIWACVDGGTDADVALSLLTGKSMGCNWNGAVTVNVLNPTSGQTYPVKFDRPDAVPIFARVTLKAGTFTGDATTLVREAILAYAAGLLSGMTGFQVGTAASPFELAAAVVAVNPGVFVPKVEVSLDGSTWQTTEIAVDLDEIATIQSSAITALVV